MPNQNDKKIWNSIFEKPPLDWKTVPEIPQMKHCTQFFKKENIHTVLDIGCGPGVWANFLSNAGFQISGFDFSESAVEYARAWAKEKNTESKFKCGSITDIPFKEIKFDGAVAALILDNVSKEECKLAIKEIQNSLKLNAVLFALFNPLLTEEMKKEFEESDNPTKEITSISYSNSEIKELFQEDFKLAEFKVFEDGTRGAYLQKQQSDG